MANPINPGSPNGPQFKPVKSAYDIQTGARTKTQGGDVYPTGRTPLNVRGTFLLDRLAVEAGQDVEQYDVEFEADDVNHLVSVAIATQVHPGVLPIRRSKTGRTLAIHLGGVFEEYPLLRVPSKRKCQVWRGTDSKGRPAMIISLGTGLSTRTTTKQGSESESKPEVKAEKKTDTKAASKAETKAKAEAKPEAQTKGESNEA